MALFKKIVKNRKVTKQGEDLFGLSSYVTDREKAKIQSRADELRITVSAYLRICALKGIKR